MSYNLTLSCGCAVYVSCHPATNYAHTRIIERRGAQCRHRRHAVGERVWLWEMLPDAGGAVSLERAADQDAYGEFTLRPSLRAGIRR